MDIVERLRRYRPTYGWPEERSVIVEPTLNHVAADEIERLRLALQHILTHCKSDTPPNAQAIILFANKALGKERLGEIATDAVGWMPPASVNGPREEYQNEIKELTDDQV